MKLTGKRAEIATATVLLVVGIFGAGAWGWYKLTEPGRNKKIATQAAHVAALADAQAKAEHEKTLAVQAATQKAAEEHARERRLRDQIDANASGFVEGAKIALATNQTPTQAELVAMGLLESASTALGQPLTDQQRQVWTKTVAGLIVRNAESEAKVAQLTKEAGEVRAALGEVRARADAADGHVAKLTHQLSEHAKELVKTTGQAAELTAENKAWAQGEQNLWGRFKALFGLILLLAGVLIFLSLRYRGVSATLKDAVALGEHLKTVAVDAGRDVKEVEDKVAAWWENDEAAKARLNKIKSQLRL